jgi:hypothetical protein
MRLLRPFALDEEERVVPRRYDEGDGAPCVTHGHGISPAVCIRR